MPRRQGSLTKIISSLRRLGTADVCDALIKPRVMSARVRPITEVKKLVGAAVTARVSGGSTLTIRETIASASAGDLLVVESRGKGEVAIFGGTLASEAVRKGVAGVIVDGHVRDIDEISRLRLPVWAIGTCPYATHGKLLGKRNIQVVCGGVRVNAGDIVIADSDGVVIVSPSEALEAIRKVEDIRREERRLPSVRRN